MTTYARIRLLGWAILPIVCYCIPSTWVVNGHPVCLFRNMGLPCYGCGMTRALYTLLHGDFAAAYEYNPLVIIVAPLLLCLYIKELSSSARTVRSGREL